MPENMAGAKLLCAIFATAISLSQCYVNIPDELKRGKMMRFDACWQLVRQNVETSIQTSERQGSMTKVCVCTYHEENGFKKLSANCSVTRDVVIPIQVSDYEFFRRVLHYLVKYRPSGSSVWEEKTIEATENPQFRVELKMEKSRFPSIYEVKVFAVLGEGNEKLIFSDEISASTGKSIKPFQRYILPVSSLPSGSSAETEYSQSSQSFRMTFDRITDTSMDVIFDTATPDDFQVHYLVDGAPVLLNFDRNGHASLEGLTPSTEYIFRISVIRNGVWTVMREKAVRTMASRPSFVGTYDRPSVQPLYPNQGVTLRCPVSDLVNLQEVSWYKGSDRRTAQHIATWEAESGTTTYARDRDPRLTVVDGTILKITESSQDLAGTYKCRFQVLGLGSTWGSVTPAVVRMYITWTTRYSDAVEYYQILHRPFGQAAQWQEIVIENQGSPSATISGLQPETKYEFQVYDYSGRVRGNLLASFTQTTPLNDQSPSEGNLVVESQDDACGDFSCGRGQCVAYPEAHCVCESAFTGQYCDIAINFCAPNPCENGGQCITLPTGYVCRCESGYRGTNCQSVPDYCENSPCVRGRCVSGSSGYTCECYSGFSGRRCDRRVNHCQSNPCINGNCRNTVQNYQCICHSGFEGENCESVGDICRVRNPCTHGTCVPQGNSYLCRCYTGFTGTNCDEAINVCRTRNPCRFGTCESRGTSYTCRCAAGYSGTNCDQLTDLCRVRNPCVYGTCQPQGSTYVCRCRTGYTGRNCDQVSSNQCSRNPCQNGGLCIDMGSTYKCRCRRGNEGRNCERTTPVDYCELRPCVHGRCRSESRTYTCICEPGFSGRNCDEIDSSPYIVLRCPIDQRYGDVHRIIWYVLGERAEQIYSYDVIGRRGQQGTARRYLDRVSTPSTSPSKLRISDITSADVTSYQCRAEYEVEVQTSHPMELFQVEEGDRSITVEWRPTRSYIDHYDAKYRDASRDGPFRITELRKDANEHTFGNLISGHIYELYILPYAGGRNEAPRPIHVQSAPVSRADDAAGKEPSTVLDRTEKYSEPIEVRVQGPNQPMTEGETAYFDCQYPSVTGYKPSIKWMKTSGERSIFLYNKKMPPRSISSSRITMIDEHRLRIKSLVSSDTATYECSVTYDMDDRFRVGSDSAQLRVNGRVELAAPTNFRSQVIGETTTTIHWQHPNPSAITKYVVRYWPTTRYYGQDQTLEVQAMSASLLNLREGNEYTVEITATDGRQFSQPLRGTFSQYIEVVPMPTDFRVAILSPTEARVTWSQPEPDGITGYKIQYWDVSKPAPNNLKQITTQELQTTLNDLVDGATYQVWIQAMKGARLSPQLASQFTKSTPSLPSSPQNVRFKNITPTSLTISWESPDDWRRTDKYRVKYDSVDYQNPQSRVFPDSAAQMLKVNNLQPGTTYRFTIYTVRDVGLSAPVVEIVRTYESIVLNAPFPKSLTLECKAQTTNEPYRVRWYKVDDSGRSRLIFTSTSTSTKREFSPNPNAAQFSGRLSTESMKNLTIANLQYPADFGTYKCLVKTRSGDGTDYIVLSGLYPEVRRIEPPTHFTVQLTSESTALVRWRHPNPDSITSYHVRYWPTIKRFDSEKTLDVTERQAVLTNLVKGTEYQVVIKALIGTQESDDSLVGQFINFSDKVTNVEVNRIEGRPGELVLTWQNPPNIDGILFSIMKPNYPRWNDQPPMAPDTEMRRIYMPLGEGETVSFKITTLKNNIPTPVVVHYEEPRISGIEEAIPTPSAILPITASERTETEPPQSTYPSPPSKLVVDVVGPNSIRARWEPPLDLYYDEYKLVVTNLITETYEIFRIPDSAHLITDLTSGGTYEVSVSTVRGRLTSTPITKIVSLVVRDAVAPTEGVPISYAPVGGVLEPSRVPHVPEEREPAPLEKLEREISSDVESPQNVRVIDEMRSRFTVVWDIPEEQNDISEFRVKYRPRRPSGSEEPWVSEDVSGRTFATFTDLRPSTVYEIRVSSYRGDYESFPAISTATTKAFNERRVALTQPDANIVEKTATSITVRWTPQEATHLVLATPLRSTSGQKQERVPSGTNSVTVTGLEPSTRYRVRITATANGRQSVEKVLFITTNPSPPENVRVTATDSDTISLTWTDTTTLTTGYKVLYFPTLTSDMKSVDADENRITLTGLTPDTAYTIMVQTKRGNDYSESATVNATTKSVKLTAPQTVSAQAYVDDIRLSWSPVSEADYYEVTMYPEGDAGDTQRHATRQPNQEIANVLPGNYVIRVSAVKENRRGPTKDITYRMPVQMPSNLEVIETTSDSLMAAWRAPSTGMYEPEFDVIALPTSVLNPVELPPEQRTRETTHSFENLRPDTEYRIEVVTRYGSQKSQPVTELVKTAAVEQPRSLQTTVSNGLIRVMWRAVDNIDGYEISYYRVGDESNVITRKLPSDTNYFDITDAQPGDYEIRVTSVKGNQSSPSSRIVGALLGVDAPLAIRFPDITEDTLVVEWTPPRTRQRFNYEVTVYRRDDHSRPITTKNTEENWLRLDGLEPNTQYIVDLVSIFGGQKSTPLRAYVSTAQVEKPRRVNTQFSEGNVRIEWSPVQNVDYYEVVYYPVGEQENAVTNTVTTPYYEITDLGPGNYEITVTAVRDGHRSPAVKISQIIEIPRPDSVLAVYRGGDTEIVWDVVPGAESYEIEYYPVGGNSRMIVTEGGQTHTVLNNLLPNTEYIVEVNAIVNDNSSSPTVIHLTTPSDIGSQPLTSGNNTVTIEWVPGDADSEYEVKYYTVTRSGEEEIYGTPVTQSVPLNQQGVVLRDLEPDTEYVVEIIAVGRDGTEKRPIKFTVTTPLDQPDNIVIGRPGSNEVPIQWVPSKGDVTEYVIEFTPTDGSEVVTIPVRPDRNAITASGLRPNTEYEVRVVARNRDKDREAASLTQVIRTQPLDTRPSQVRIVGNPDGTYTVTWVAPAHSVQNYRIIYVKTSGEPIREEYLVSGESSQTTIPLLIPNNEYEITVQSLTSGRPEPSDYDSVTTVIRTQVPAVPDRITFPYVTDTSLIVQWDVPDLEEYLTGYRVDITPEGSGRPSDVKNIPRTSNSATFTELRPSTNYQVTVTPHINGTPGRPGKVKITTDELLEVPIPGYVHVAEVTSDEMVVQWYAPENAEYITGFHVLVQDNRGNTVFNEKLPKDVYMYTLSDLTPGSTYDIFVRSLIGRRESEPGRTTSSTRSTQPQRVVSFNVLPNQFEVSWEPAHGGPVSYLVNVTSLDNPNDQQLLRTSGTSIIVPDVQPGSTYVVEVISISEEGLESTPSLIQVTTGTHSEPRPTDDVRPKYSFTVVPGAPELIINWENLIDLPVLSYQVLYKPKGTSEPKIINVPAGVTQTVLSSLRPNDVYDVWVRGVLETLESVPVPVSGKETVTDIPVENYRPLTEEPIVAPEDGKMTVTWESLGPDITNYGVTYYRPSNEDEVKQYQVVVPGDYSGTIISDLIPGEEYIVSVIGIRGNSQPVIVRNANVGKSPYIPDESSATASSPNGQLTIEWVNDVDSDDIIGYKIRFDRKCCLGEPEMAWVPGKDSDTATIGMLEPNTEYVFTVEATTTNGQNHPVSSIQILDEVEFPETDISEWLSPPTITRLEGEGYTTTIHWRPPEEGTRPITHYTITYTPTNNPYAPSVRVTVPESETSHTMTGLNVNTNYNISVQSVNLPTKTSSPVVTRTYLTPIDGESGPDEDYSYPDDTEEGDRYTIEPIRTLAPHEPTPGNVPFPVEPHGGRETRTFPNPTRVGPGITHRPRTFPTPTRVPPRTPHYTSSTTTPLPLPIENNRTPEPEDYSSLEFTSNDLGFVTLDVPFAPFDVDRLTVTYWQVDQPDFIQEVDLPSTTEQFTISSLEPNVNYRVAVTQMGDGNEFITRPEEVPAGRLPETLNTYQWIFPSEITEIIPFDTDSTVIRWKNPETQPRKATHYIIKLTPSGNTDSDSETLEAVVPAPSTSYVVTGLLPGQEYTVTLESVHNGTSTRSRDVTRDFIAGTPWPGTDFDVVPITRPIPTTTSRPFTTRSKPAPVDLPRRSRPTLTTRRPTPSRAVFPEYTPARSTDFPFYPTFRPIVPIGTTKRTPILVDVTTFGPLPIEEGNREVTLGEGEEGEVPDTPGSTGDDEADVQVLPTFDGNVIINWTPAENPVGSYTVEYRNSNDDSPAERIKVSGDESYVNIPEVPKGQTYVITIYANEPGKRPEIIYNVRLNRSEGPTDNYKLEYEPGRIVTRPGGPTQARVEYIPAERPSVQLPDDQYTLQLPGSETVVTTTDQEYTNWITPIKIPSQRVGGIQNVTLLWNPETTLSTDRRTRYRLRLVPIGRPESETIVLNAPANRQQFYIQGLRPGVSYRLFAEYIRSDGRHRAGDIAANFTIPAFSRFGTPIVHHTGNIFEVWMKELLSGQLMLQWDDIERATGYRVEYQLGTDGDIITRETGVNSKWVILPRLEPGQTYNVNIYAMIDGYYNQIYTVTIRHKITGPEPPSKVEWYNMFGHSVDLSWVPPRGVVTGYRLTYAPEGDTEPTIYDLPANMTTFHLDNLVPGQTYVISIQTIRSGEISRPLTFRLKMLVPTVRKIYFQQTGANVVVIRWPALPDYVTGYRINVKSLGHDGRVIVPDTDLAPDTTSYTINNVEPGVRYEFTIKTMVGEKLSESVVLHLWILRAESQLPRIEESGTWTVSWTGSLQDVDYWRIEVTPYGSRTPVFREDRIDPTINSYKFTDLTPGIEYTVSIYGVKDGVSSTPIQVRIPADPTSVLSHGNQINTRRQHVTATGVQLVSKFLVRRRPTELEIDLTPVGAVDSYVVEYKKTTDSVYTSEGVSINYGDSRTDPSTAIIRNLEENASYKIKVTAVRGTESSVMVIDISTPQSRRPQIQQASLPILTGFRRESDPRDTTGFYIKWNAASVPVQFYNVTYTYTQTGVTRTEYTQEPSVHVPAILEDNSADYIISYTTTDGRRGPATKMNMSYGRRRTRSLRRALRSLISRNLKNRVVR